MSYFIDWSYLVSGMVCECSGGVFGYDVEEIVCIGGMGFGLLV